MRGKFEHTLVKKEKGVVFTLFLYLPSAPLLNLFESTCVKVVAHVLPSTSEDADI
jgi:hypothetical protein